LQLLNPLKAAKLFLLISSVTPLREPFHFKQTSSQIQHGIACLINLTIIVSSTIFLVSYKLKNNTHTQKIKKKAKVRVRRNWSARLKCIL
jgi:hypothetical protein